MKQLQPNYLIIACLASIVILIIFPILSKTAAKPSTATSRFDQTQPETTGSNPTPISMNKAPVLEPELPDTAGESSVEPSPNQLITEPYSVSKENRADFHNFATQVSNGQKDVIRGVYVPGLFSFPVIQQPKNNPIFVSNKHNQVTQFQSAARNEVVGLLAHNYLAGGLFYKLAPGHEILTVYGDGAIKRYRVVSIHRYQKLRPSNLHSNLVDLDSGEELPAAEVFRRFYQGKHHLTFQTCLERNGRLDWGFLFVVAVPLEPSVF